MKGKNQGRVKGRFAPCAYTPQEAFEVLQSLPVGQRTHAEAMSKAGKPSSLATLRKWRIRHNWEGRLDLNTGRHVHSTVEVLETLKKLGAQMSPEVLTGFVAELLKRLYYAIPMLDCRTLEDAKGLLDLIAKVLDLRQRMMGNPQSSSDYEDELPDFPDFSRNKSN